MILFADSGGTSTDWMTSDDANRIYKTKGMSPYVLNDSQLMEILSSSELNEFKDEVKALYFFGTGCSEPAQVSRMKSLMQSFFSNAHKIEIDHDIMGACRALYGSENGIALILGTGTNACLYQNQEIVKDYPGLGYVLGDFGSGTDMGKRIINDFCFGKLPKPIEDYIQNQLNLNKAQILDKVYKQTAPNQFIASFSQVAYHFRDEVYIQSLLKLCFMAMIEYHILPLISPNFNNVRAVGSVAYVFQDELKNCLKMYQITLDTIIQSPIESIRNYYLTHNK